MRFILTLLSAVFLASCNIPDQVYTYKECEEWSFNPDLPVGFVDCGNNTAATVQVILSGMDKKIKFYDSVLSYDNIRKFEDLNRDIDILTKKVERLDRLHDGVVNPAQ